MTHFTFVPQFPHLEKMHEFIPPDSVVRLVCKVLCVQWMQAATKGRVDISELWPVTKVSYSKGMLTAQTLGRVRTGTRKGSSQALSHIPII